MNRLSRSYLHRYQWRNTRRLFELSVNQWIQKLKSHGGANALFTFIAETATSAIPCPQSALFSIIFMVLNIFLHDITTLHWFAFLTVNSAERLETCSTAGLKWWRFRLQLVVCTLTWTPWRIVSNPTDAAALFLGCFGELIHRATLSTDHIDCGCFKTAETLTVILNEFVPCSYGSAFPKHLIIRTWTLA